MSIVKKHISKFEAFSKIMRDARNELEGGTFQLGQAGLASVRLFGGSCRGDLGFPITSVPKGSAPLTFTDRVSLKPAVTPRNFPVFIFVGIMNFCRLRFCESTVGFCENRTRNGGITNLRSCGISKKMK